MSTNVHSRAVQRAAELAGGREALAERLGLPAADINAWLVGPKRPSLDVLLRIVAVILDETEGTKKLTP